MWFVRDFIGKNALKYVHIVINKNQNYTKNDTSLQHPRDPQQPDENMVPTNRKTIHYTYYYIFLLHRIRLQWNVVRSTPFKIIALTHFGSKVNRWWFRCFPRSVLRLDRELSATVDRAFAWTTSISRWCIRWCSSRLFERSISTSRRVSKLVRTFAMMLFEWIWRIEWIKTILIRSA
jgi:hypothetical protein